MKQAGKLLNFRFTITFMRLLPWEDHLSQAYTLGSSPSGKLSLVTYVVSVVLWRSFALNLYLPDPLKYKLIPRLSYSSFSMSFKIFPNLFFAAYCTGTSLWHAHQSNLELGWEVADKEIQNSYERCTFNKGDTYNWNSILAMTIAARTFFLSRIRFTYLTHSHLKRWFCSY